MQLWGCGQEPWLPGIPHGMLIFTALAIRSIVIQRRWKLRDAARGLTIRTLYCMATLNRSTWANPAYPFCWIQSSHTGSSSNQINALQATIGSLLWCRAATSC